MPNEEDPDDLDWEEYEPEPDIDECEPDENDERYEREPTPEEIDEWRESLREEVDAFFGKFLAPRVEFLKDLAKERPSEAFLLAFCYMDGLARWVYKGEGKERVRFARIIGEHGPPDHELSKILVKRVRPKLERLNQVPKDKLGRLFDRIGARDELPRSEFCELFAKVVGSGFEGKALDPIIWDGSRASLLYQAHRNYLVHELGLAQIVLVGIGEPTPGWVVEVQPIVSFESLYAALAKVVDGVRSREDIFELFGHAGTSLRYEEDPA